jgi:16S rRNA processing protein RimM
MAAPAAPEWIEFGYLARAHGVRGEVRLVPMEAEGDLPERVERVRITAKDGRERLLTLTAVRPTQGALLVCFDGIDDRDAAQALAGSRVFVEASTLPPLEAGEIYLYELVGVAAQDQTGRAVGIITGLFDNHGQDVLVLRGPDGGERLLPLADDTLVRFDREAPIVILQVPQGLWD